LLTAPLTLFSESASESSTRTGPPSTYSTVVSLRKSIPGANFAVGATQILVNDTGHRFEMIPNKPLQLIGVGGVICGGERQRVLPGGAVTNHCRDFDRSSSAVLAGLLGDITSALLVTASKQPLPGGHSKRPTVPPRNQY
jgi:hypothetical protein